MMGKVRSPIEMMIDKACGFDPATYVEPPKITLRCPSCKKEQRVHREKMDPKNATVMETDCPDCFGSGNFEHVAYFDAAGRELHFETGEPITPPRPRGG